MNASKKYLITLLIGFVGVALIVWAKDIFDQTSLSGIYHILSDAFLVAGTVLTAFGLLIFSNNEGSFDGLVFGVNSFLNVFRRNPKEKYTSYRKYKESREGPKGEFGFLVICGLFFLAIAIVMYFLYRRYS